MEQSEIYQLCDDWEQTWDDKARVETNLSSKLLLNNISNRNRYYKLIQARYRELIINIRDYKNLPQSINKYALEFNLRNHSNCVIGRDRLGNIQLLGYIANNFSISDPKSMFAQFPNGYNDVIWDLPKNLIPKKSEDYYEITQLDNAESGEFVVLRNKPVQYMSDFEMIEFYAKRMAELESSRASLINQAKVSQVFAVENGDTTTVNQLIAMQYNAAPFLQVGTAYDVNSKVATLGDPAIADKIKTLKLAFNDEMNELNNFLGINTVGVDKASGVSKDESDSNNDYIAATDNIYINGVREGLDLLNKRFGTDFKVYMNQPNVDNLINSIGNNEDPVPMGESVNENNN